MVFLYFDLLQRFELVTYDYRFRLKHNPIINPRIMVIEISDDSIQEIGRWPWTRDWHADLVRVLHEWGASAVVFDILFPEKSEPSHDKALSDAIRLSKKVFLAEALEKLPSGEERLISSIPEFSNYAKGTGHINLEPDADGTMRRIPLFVEHRGKKIPQLSLAVALSEMGLTMDDVVVKGDAAYLYKPGGEKITIPLERGKNLVLYWAGRWQEAFHHVSFKDVIKSYADFSQGKKPSISPEKFKNKICYVGAAATGLFDIRPTPLEPAYPAVGVNLNVLNNLLEKRFIRVLTFSQNALILCLLAVLMFFVMKLESTIQSAILSVGAAVLYILMAIGIFQYFDLWVNIVYGAALIFLIYFCTTLYNQIMVTVERTRLFKLATRDSLTGLYNIGHFKSLLKAEMSSLSFRGDKNLSIIMGDVDNFKHTNDTYGHLTGDMVLKSVAESIKTNCRALDVAARYGGEEIIVMLPGAGAEDASKVAEKIRKTIHQKVFFHEKGDFSTSISLGVAQVIAEDKEVEAVIARADKALYDAKHAGKNRVVIAPKMALDNPGTR